MARVCQVTGTGPMVGNNVSHANSCFFTMVAVDESGKPCSVPAFMPVSTDEVRRFKAAQLRRELRQEFEQRSREILRTGSAS